MVQGVVRIIRESQSQATEPTLRSVTENLKRNPKKVVFETRSEASYQL